MPRKMRSPEESRLLRNATFARCHRWLVPWKIAFLAPMLIVMAALSTSAQVLPVSLQDMVERAGIIVSGRVVDVRQGGHPDYPHVTVTYVTVEIEESFKGLSADRRRFTFMQFGGQGLTRVPELPSYRQGERVILFLYPKSRYGFTSPVGGIQGKLSVQPDPRTGERRVTLVMPRARFLEGLSQEVRSLMTDSIEPDELTTMRYRAFRAVIRRLVSR